VNYGPWNPYQCFGAVARTCLQALGPEPIASHVYKHAVPLYVAVYLIFSISYQMFSLWMVSVPKRSTRSDLRTFIWMVYRYLQMVRASGAELANWCAEGNES
jgi:hypothetical protein